MLEAAEVFQLRIGGKLKLDSWRAETHAVARAHSPRVSRSVQGKSEVGVAFRVHLEDEAREIEGHVAVKPSEA